MIITVHEHDTNIQDLIGVLYPLLIILIFVNIPESEVRKHTEAMNSMHKLERRIFVVNFCNYMNQKMQYAHSLLVKCNWVLIMGHTLIIVNTLPYCITALTRKQTQVLTIHIS